MSNRGQDRVSSVLACMRYVCSSMRFTLLLVAACGAQASRPPPPVDKPIANSGPTCTDAAHGLEGATKGVREPDSEVFEQLVKRCTDDRWPATVVECFARMHEGDLGRCSSELPERSREAMFGVIAGSEPSVAGIAVARARLEMLKVGVPQCDEFVVAVTSVLSCEQMPLETRVDLGNETAQFWSLPTARLGPDDLRSISDVCGKSLLELQQRAAEVGC
jgi:hypothetical protein